METVEQKPEEMIASVVAGRKIKHGRYGYERYGCRCVICRAAIAVHQRNFQSRNRDRVRTKDIKRYADDPSRNRVSCWKRDGIKLDWADYQAMLQLQKYECAICEKTIVEKAKDGPLVACVDHEHSSGRVRGLLCRKCNLMLGYAGDSADVLAKGIVYLRKANRQ
jgi:hypothetical protein